MLANGSHPQPKTRTGRQLNNPVLVTQGWVTVIDGLLAVAALAGLVLNAAAPSLPSS